MWGNSDSRGRFRDTQRKSPSGAGREEGGNGNYSFDLSGNNILYLLFLNFYFLI